MVNESSTVIGYPGCFCIYIIYIISARKKAIREKQRIVFVVQSCSVDTPASFGLVGLASTHVTQCPCLIVCIALVGQVEVKYADY